VPDRRGYGRSRVLTASGSLEEQLDDIDDLLAEVAGDQDAARVTLVGVSGGATLALALAIRRARAGVAGPRVVAHEPLVGALAPSLAARVRESYAATLQRDPTQASHYVAELVGPATWARLDDDARARVAADAWTIATEVPGFLAFEPALSDLACLPDRGLVTSVGARSPELRREAVEVLRTAADAETWVIEGAGHLPQVDAPECFAAALTVLTASAAAPDATTSRWAS
jgi:pimeloyl-ACP methyl ester carboxylesterase